MKKILELNLENSKITSSDFKKYKKNVDKIHQTIINKSGEGNQFMDWTSWPVNYDKDEVKRINAKVKWLKTNNVDTLLVVGIGGSFLGAQSAIDFIKGKMNKQDEIIFTGINMSSTHIKQIEKKLENKNWAICVISKSGTTLEPALSFRHFKTLLEKKLKSKSKDYIVSITDGKKGALKELSDSEGYETFVVPDGIGGRFSGTTPVGLFPMAFAGINIEKVLEGSRQAMEDLKESENNIAYDYALSRFILNTKYKKVSEIFTVYDFDLDMTAEWWKQLFGESEGKNGKGLMPSSVIYSRDLHSLGQIIQDGNKNFFETTLWIEEEKNNVVVGEDKKNLDGLNYLTGKTFHEINKKAFEGVLEAHSKDGNIPNIVLNLKDKSEESIGYLWYFFFISVTMSAYLLGVNPFNQPGVELYKSSMFSKLKK